MRDDILGSFKWNEASFDPDPHQEAGLVSIVSFDEAMYPTCIGTAFIIANFGPQAIALTAAHNFYDGVGSAQKVRSRFHRSALPDFVPGFEKISIDSLRLRGVWKQGDRGNFCKVGEVIWDKARDMALLTLIAEDEEPIFDSFFSLTISRMVVGDLVGCMGFADMSTVAHDELADGTSFTISRRLVFRCGRVKAIFPDGARLIRGPCIEFSAPVFGGMSGGPVFKMASGDGPIIPFGVISSDLQPQNDVNEKNDRSVEGSTLASLIPFKSVQKAGSQTWVALTMRNDGRAHNVDLLRPAKGDAKAD